MSKRLYPLNFLRTFEVSARHLSFAGAAEELCVTRAAVNQQVRRLEDYLGVKLFLRKAGKLMLSDKGQILTSELSEIFLRLDQVVEKTFESGPGKILTVSVVPMFASKLLVPWLHKFNTLHPDIDVQITPNFGDADFNRDNFDVAIVLGQKRSSGLKIFKLFEEHVTPMCAPQLLQGLDFSKTPLLHNDFLNQSARVSPNWNTWLQSHGVTETDTSLGEHFNHPDHALQAAIDGAGVVLGWRGLAANDLAIGRLKQPFQLILPLGIAFYLVYPEAYANRTEIIQFRDWLMEKT